MPYLYGEEKCMGSDHLPRDGSRGFGRQILREGGQGTYFSTMVTNTLPEGLEDGIEGFNTVGSGGFGESGQRQSGDGADLLLLINQTVFNDFDKGAQMRQDGTTHENGNLLNDLDAGVASLP